MDIKLKAKLCAYSRVETFQPADSMPGVDGSCELVSTGPVREERIDTLFSSTPVKEEQTPVKSAGASFIDSLF